MTNAKQDVECPARDRPELRDGTGADKSERLRFETQDDALYYARQIVESSHSRLAAENFSLADYYHNCGCYICVELSPKGDARQFKLIMREIPDISLKPCVFNLANMDSNSWIMDAYCKDALMLVWTSHSAESPKFAVPSEVWVEVADELDNLGVNAWFNTSARDFAFEIINVSPHWKVDGANVCETKATGRVACSLIKRISQLIDNSISCDPDSRWDFLESMAKDALSGLRIEAFDSVIRASLDEICAARFEVTRTFFRALDE